MLNDIFATAMSGEYQTREHGGVLERGTWSYEGYGNAEIMMQAEGEITEDGLRYSVMIHSAERQLNEVEYRSTWSIGDRQEEHRLRAIITGHDISIIRHDDSTERSGSLTSPDEAIYDGPSPIWMIHLMLTSLPPVDVEVVTPVIHFDERHGPIVGRFFRVTRGGLMVNIIELDEDAKPLGQREIHLADDGCPQLIRSGSHTTEIIRLPKPSL